MLTLLLLLACSPEAAPPLSLWPALSWTEIYAYVSLALTALTAMAPKSTHAYPLVRLLARFTIDLRGILTSTPDDDSPAVKSWKGGNLLVLLALLSGCSWLRDSALPVAAECAPDQVYLIEGLVDILAGADAFQVLDDLKREKGAAFVACAVKQFLARAGTSPETAEQRARASAYLKRG